MSKVQGPLLSLTAAGTVGKALTFRKNGPHVLAETKPHPSNPRTPAQQAQRARCSNCGAFYRTLADPDRAAWGNSAVASARPVTPYNMCMQAAVAAQKADPDAAMLANASLSNCQLSSLLTSHLTNLRTLDPIEERSSLLLVFPSYPPAYTDNQPLLWDPIQDYYWASCLLWAPIGVLDAYARDYAHDTIASGRFLMLSALAESPYPQLPPPSVWYHPTHYQQPPETWSDLGPADQGAVLANAGAVTKTGYVDHGATGQVKAPPHATWQQQACTLLCWVKLDAPIQPFAFNITHGVPWATTSQFSWRLECYTGSWRTAYSWNYGFKLLSLPGADSAWHQLGFTYDASNFRLFLDGTVQDAAGTTNPIYYPGTRPTITGARDSFLYGNHASVSDIQWFPQALSPGQVLAWHNATADRYI